jgi:hypothetical protein
VNDGRQPCWLTFAPGLYSFKLHVALLPRSLVIQLEHHSSDQADDGALVGDDADHVGAPLGSVLSKIKLTHESRWLPHQCASLLAELGGHFIHYSAGHYLAGFSLVTGNSIRLALWPVKATAVMHSSMIRFLNS